MCATLRSRYDLTKTITLLILYSLFNLNAFVAVCIDANYLIFQTVVHLIKKILGEICKLVP